MRQFTDQLKTYFDDVTLAMQGCSKLGGNIGQTILKMVCYEIQSNVRLLLYNCYW